METLKFRRLLLAALVGMAGTAAMADDPYVYEFAPGVIGIPEGEASASKFVWPADGAPTNGAIAFIRQTFTLPAKPAEATIKYMLDDKGEVYVNGQALHWRENIAKDLVAGSNTIAVALTNVVSGAGTIFMVTCKDAQGELSYIHSDATAKGTVQVPSAGWEQKVFDDSAWPQVSVVGDALAEPWVNYYLDSLTRNFMTPEEKARYDEENALANSWPEGLDEEPDPVARVVYRGSRPFIEINGELLDPLMNICATGDPYNDSAIVRCAEAGFRIVQLNFNMDHLYNVADGTCDFSAIETSVRRLLRLNPDAYFMLSIRYSMVGWATAHPDEQIGYGTGPADPNCEDERTGRAVRPSPASDQFRTLALGLIRELADYVNARPWGKRLVGFRPCYGVYTEWHCYGMYDAPDTGLRMQEKFRAYMKAKRDVDDAQVPTAAMRRHENANAEDNGDILDPATDQLVLDYYDCFANTMADLLFAMAAESRQDFPGRLIGAYYGYVFDFQPPEGANVLLDRVLSNPNIDFLSNPPYYSSVGRRAGGSNVARTIPSLFRRYGKLSFLEDDSRFHHIREWLRSNNDGLALATETPRETEMDMRRNWLNRFFDGDGIQINDPITNSGRRPHAFDDPAVFKAISDAEAALAEAGDPAPESGNKVAVVMSYRERLRMDGGQCTYFTWNLYSTSFLYLNQIGMAFDILSLEDYIAHPGDYKVVLFLNAFYLTAEERAALVAQTRKPGMTAIWIGPAGGVTDAGFDNAAMSALTGITADGVARRPRVVCRDPAAVRMGQDCLFYVKALAGGARSIIVPETPNSAERYRAILQEAGAWMYTAPGSYFRRHGNIFMFHTGTAGTHTIRLPDDVLKVRELFTGMEYNSDELTLQTDGPNTWLFRVTPKVRGFTALFADGGRSIAPDLELVSSSN